MLYVLLFLAVVTLGYVLWHWRLLLQVIGSQVAMYEAHFGNADDWRKKLRGDDANNG